MSPEWGQIVEALLHSLWQAGSLALLLGLALKRLTSPAWRYRFAIGSLGGVLLATILTWGVLNQRETNQLGSPGMPAEGLSASFEPEHRRGAGEKLIFTAAPFPRRGMTTGSMNWTTWLAPMWLLGAVLMLVRAGIQVAGAERLRRSGRPLEDARIAQLLAETQRAIGLARTIRIAVTNTLTSPAVVGVLIPTLILPLSLVTALTHEQLRFVLLHELAHIRRGDYFVNLFQLFVEALLFFNPAVWWISHQVRREREACCDALAIELSGAPVDYARTLVHVAENALSPSPAAAAAFGNKRREPSSLSDRVQRLLVPGYHPELRLTWRAMLMSLVVGGILLVLLALGTRNTVGAILAEETHAKPQANDPATLAKPTIPTEDAEGSRVQAAALTNKVSSSATMPVQFAEQLYTRTFKISPAELSRTLGITNHSNDHTFLARAATNANGIRYLTSTNSLEAAHRAMRTLFADAGVDLQAPKAVFYNDRVGELFVRATIKDLDRLTQILAGLGDEPSPDRAETDASGLVQSARLLLEAGKPDEAETKLKAALDVEPENQAALYYLSYVKESRIRNAKGDRVVRESAEWSDREQTTAGKLYSRRYKIDRELFYRRAGITFSPIPTNTMQNVHQRVINLFTDSGANMGPQEVVYYSDRREELMVRATAANMDKVEKLVAGMVSESTPARATVESSRSDQDREAAAGKQKLPSILIEAKFIELTDFNPEAEPPDSPLRNLSTVISTISKTNPATSKAVMAFRKKFGPTNNLILETVSPATVTQLLTKDQADALVAGLIQRSGVDILSAPKVSTTEGRPAQIQVTDMRTIVTAVETNLTANADGKQQGGINYLTEAIPFGSVLDVVPSLDATADGKINFTILAHNTEFIGYDDPGDFVVSVVSSPGALPLKGVFPLPRARFRELNAPASIQDGQSILLSGPVSVNVTRVKNRVPVLGDIPLLGKLFRSTKTSTVKKHLLVLVKASLVDEKGAQFPKAHPATQNPNPFHWDATAR